MSQFPTPKDEDLYVTHVAEEIPGAFADGIFCVFDGHSGRIAAQECVRNFVAFISKYLQGEGGEAPSPKTVKPGIGPDGWPLGLDQAIRYASSDLNQVGATPTRRYSPRAYLTATRARASSFCGSSRLHRDSTHSHQTLRSVPLIPIVC